jgi:hypothetical protein
VHRNEEHSESMGVFSINDVLSVYRITKTFVDLSNVNICCPFLGGFLEASQGFI